MWEFLNSKWSLGSVIGFAVDIDNRLPPCACAVAHANCERGAVGSVMSFHRDGEQVGWDVDFSEKFSVGDGAAVRVLVLPLHSGLAPVASISAQFEPGSISWIFNERDLK
jgi:hypothetical protein